MGTNKKPAKGAFNLSEAAAFAGVSLPTMAAWANRPGFPAFKAGRRWIVPVDSFKTWLDEQAKSRAQL